ncbi:MAG: DUF2330 domain-containing protein, partial [Thermoplasmatota archaeon]
MATSFLPLVQGDGGFIPVSIQEIFESSQNAIIGWDGETEWMCLSVNIYAEEDTEGFHVVPFPSMPEVQLGDVRIFERYREKLGGFSDRYSGWGQHLADSDGYGRNASPTKVDIMFNDTIGEHDVTVVRVNDMNGFEEELLAIIKNIGISLEGYPAGLEQIVKNYTSRGSNYFSIDHYPIYKKEKTIEPLVYTFKTDSLVFPLEISSMLEGSSLVRLGLLTSPHIPIDLSAVKSMGSSAYSNTRSRLVGGEDLYFIDDGLWSMFPEGAVSTYIQASISLFRVRGDLEIPRSRTIDWSRPCPFMTPGDYTHEFSFIEVEGTDRIVLYNREASLGHDSRVICINRTDGSTSWELSRSTGTIGRYNDRMSVVIFNEDHDEDGFGDLILCYSDVWGTVVERIDPITGEVIWSRGGSDILYPSEILTVHDDIGTPYLCLIGPEFICAMNPATGEPKASYRTIMRDIGGSYFGGRIDTGNIHILSLDGNGEGLLFSDGYRWIVWSPFHYFEDPYGLSDLSDDNVLWEKMFQFQGLTIQNSKEYLLSVKWDDPHGEICYI